MIENYRTYPKFVPKNKTTFFCTLQKRVNEYFKDNNITKHANTEMIVKTCVLLGMFIALVSLINFFLLKPLVLVSIYVILGFLVAGIGMSVMHDANHGAYSKNKNVNKWLGYSLNLIGGMVFNWKLQHNLLHHTYTNIHEMDDDIENKAILRFSPHSNLKKIHRFQFLYVFLFYSLLVLYWTVAKDFVQYFKYKREGVNRFNQSKNIMYLVSMIFLKLTFLSYMIILPVIIQGYSWGLVVGGFLLMNAISGLVLGVVFQLAHSVEEASFPLPNSTNEIENDWAMHQMNTTVNFSPNNKLLSWYVGGLNFQVEHHLFPHICHIHYPQISKIVEQTANEFNVPYLSSPNVKQAMISHLKTLKKFGYHINMDLAKM